jgi:hypothetical protein
MYEIRGTKSLKDQELATGILKVIEKMAQDYRVFSDRCLDGNLDYMENFDIEEGRNYIKIIRSRRGSIGRSVSGFIVKKDTKKFKRGDMLKAAGWKAPATNFARGNVLDDLPEVVRWTGIQ